MVDAGRVAQSGLDIVRRHVVAGAERVEGRERLGQLRNSTGVDGDRHFIRNMHRHMPNRFDRGAEPGRRPIRLGQLEHLIADGAPERPIAAGAAFLQRDDDLADRSLQRRRDAIGDL
ncbi:hypothetical protein GCM10023319_24170 [Nocardia iowensis]